MSDMYVTPDTSKENDGGECTEAHTMVDHHIQMHPVRHCKVIHFIRHGEGFHNVAGRRSTEEYKKEDYADAHLTELGWTQAHALQKHIAQLPDPLNVEAVIVSPLSRALQTAVGAFGGTSDEEGTAKPLMLRQAHILEKQYGHSAVTSAGTPPFICWEVYIAFIILLYKGGIKAFTGCRIECARFHTNMRKQLTGGRTSVYKQRLLQWCREHLGLHPCDRRSSLTYLKQQYPAVDFSLVEEETDVYWKRESRESHDQIRERGRKFIQWLMARPEQRLAVVSHSSFMYFMLSNYGHDASETVQSEIRRWYENCEMRTVILSDMSGESGGLDPLFFPGGQSIKGPGNEPMQSQKGPAT